MPDSHTPGPWELIDKGTLANGMRIWKLVAKGDRASALFQMVEGEADARLIAAAPDLLSALERLEHSYMLLAEHKPVRDMAETLGEVRHAIVKARGEA
jgi:hypothetical protein